MLARWMNETRNMYRILVGNILKDVHLKCYERNGGRRLIDRWLWDKAVRIRTGLCSMVDFGSGGADLLSSFTMVLVTRI
jgi:hypothetical protein